MMSLNECHHAEKFKEIVHLFASAKASEDSVSRFFVASRSVCKAVLLNVSWVLIDSNSDTILVRSSGKDIRISE